MVEVTHILALLTGLLIGGYISEGLKRKLIVAQNELIEAQREWIAILEAQAILEQSNGA